MDDLELTAALASLGLDRDNHRAVLLLPLVEVAWADGRIQHAERRRIAAIARSHGIEVQEGWLDRWLTRRPSVKTFLAARTVLLALMARSGRAVRADGTPEPPQRIETLEGLLDLCQAVAQAAGGLFGLAFTVARSERECIEQIAGSLALGPALPSPVIQAWEQSRRRHFLAEAPTSARRRGPRYGILDQTTHYLNPTAIETRPMAPGKSPVTLARRLSEALEEHTAPFDTLAARASRAMSPPPAPRRAFPATSQRPGVEAPKAAVPGPEPVRVGRAGTTAVPERFSEEDPTLPFFDDVNVGTYGLDSADPESEP